MMYKNEEKVYLKESLTIRVFLFILSFIVFVALLLFCAPYVMSAPAPLLRKEKKPAIPVDCTMMWSTFPYKTHFYPGGNYDAVHEGITRYVGSWNLSQDSGGPILVIHEKLENSDCWTTYSIPLHSCLRKGRGDREGCFEIK